jgi:hypothetical protein
MMPTTTIIRQPVVSFFGIAYYVIFLLSLLLSLSCCVGGEKSSSPSYISSRALDKFGNAVQLGHAKEAALRYGRSVVVAVVENGCPSSSSSSSSSSSFLMVVSLGKTPVLRKIQLPLSAEECGKDTTTTSSPPPFVACCFTGVKGDANWLLQQIQKYFSEVWERYDMATQLSTPTIAHVIARLLGRFSGQSEKQEWQSALGLPGKNERDEDRRRYSSWSRPLGVQTMIISLQSSSLSNEPGLLLVEPSGRILNPVAKSKSGLVSLAAMGKESDKIESRLLSLLQGKQQKGKNPISILSATKDKDSSSSTSWEEFPPTLETCRDTLIRVLLEEATTTNNGSSSNEQQDNNGGDIMVETFSSDRGQIEQRLFRYENSNTFATVSSQ